MTHPRISTLGELRASGYQPTPVKVEMRNNLIRKLKAGERLFPGIRGYDDTVLPQSFSTIGICSGRMCSPSSNCCSIFSVA